MFICSADEALVFVSYMRETEGLILRRYETLACARCKLRKRCTSSSYRSIARWEHEHVFEDVQQRLDETPQAMRVSRETIEQPFGTIKERMGPTHFLMKRLKERETRHGAGRARQQSDADYEHRRNRTALERNSYVAEAAPSSWWWLIRDVQATERRKDAALVPGSSPTALLGTTVACSHDQDPKKAVPDVVWQSAHRERPLRLLY
jgi:hypothetical protein